MDKLLKILLILIIVTFVAEYVITKNQVYAQSCGSINCCRDDDWRRVCSPTGCKPGDPNCSCSYRCTGATFSQSCYPSGNSCVTQSCAYPVSGSCGTPYQPPPPPPPQNPGPTTGPTQAPAPTQPPGWGGCGSCSGCLPGDPRDPRECVRAPDGSCRWDPGSCGGGGGSPDPSTFCRIREVSGPSTIQLGQTVRFGFRYEIGRSSWRGSMIEVKDIKPEILLFNPTRQNICCTAGGNGHSAWQYFWVTGKSIGEDQVRFEVEIAERDSDGRNTAVCSRNQQFSVVPPTLPTSCQIPPLPGRTIVHFSGKHLSNYATQADSIDGPFNVPLSAGQYTATVQTYDNHTIETTPQQFESVSVSILNQAGNTVMGQTGFTPDLPNNTDHMVHTFSSSPINIPSTGYYQYQAQIQNYPAAAGQASSVMPICMALDPAPCAAPTNLNTRIASCAAHNATTGYMHVDWTAPAGTTGYQISVIHQDSGVVVNNIAVNRTEVCSGSSCTRAVPMPIGNYRVEVTATGAGCSISAPAASTPYNMWVCPYPKSGRVFLDDPNNRATIGAGGVCSGSTATPVQPGSGSSITFDPTGSNTIASIAGDGSYIAQVPGRPNPYTAILNPTQGFLCSCPEDCTISVGGTNTQNGLNFYVSLVDDPWLQVGGGDVHANASSTGNDALSGTGVFINPIPENCLSDGSCKPLSIISNEKNNPAGLLTMRGGIIDTSQADGEQRNQITEGNPSRFGVTEFPKAFNSYDNFMQWVGIGLNQMPEIYNNAKPSSGVHYYAGGLIINEAWDVDGDEKIVVVVDGDIVFGATARTSVTPGGFLGFIAKGNIIFDRNIGQSDADSLEPVMEGFFFSQGQVIIEGEPETKDRKFILEGNLIGWQGVSMGRDFKGVENNFRPVVVVNYRPDLIINAPEELKYSKTTWRTLAP